METLICSFPSQFPSNKAPVLLADGFYSEHSLHQVGQKKVHELRAATPGWCGKEKGLGYLLKTAAQ